MDVMQTKGWLLADTADPVAQSALRAFPEAFVTQEGLAAFPAHRTHDLDALADMVRADTPFPPTWKHATKPYKHQVEGFRFLALSNAAALFGEQGTGKTKILIDTLAFRMHHAGDIDLAIVVTKKGVHRQWVQQQIPTHWPDHLEQPALYFWRSGDKLPLNVLEAAKAIVAFNVDALNTQGGRTAIETLFEAFGKDRTAVIYDESHLLKNPKAKRNKAARKLFADCPVRIIATGTPLTRNPVDLYGQFLLLDRRIIGHKSIVTFRSEYCVLGGPNLNWIQGPKNLDRLNAKIAPYTYRISKEVLDLPPKVYVEQPYEMSAEQQRHYRQMRDWMLTQIETGEIVEVRHALTHLLRLQQIVHGFLPIDDGDVVDIGSNVRAAQVIDILEQRHGPAVVWCRFHHDVAALEKALAEAGISAVPHHGGMKDKDRAASIERWLDGEARVFVSTVASGSTGLNLQGKCETVIYYGHTFNAIDRWQSEDRVHRIGTQGTVTYFDIVALDTIDRHILRNLKEKRGLADAVMNDIVNMLKGGD